MLHLYVYPFLIYIPVSAATVLIYIFQCYIFTHIRDQRNTGVNMMIFSKVLIISSFLSYFKDELFIGHGKTMEDNGITQWCKSQWYNTIEKVIMG